jgi:hypothetical protein
MKGGVGGMIGELAFIVTVLASLGLVFWATACLVQAYKAVRQAAFGKAGAPGERHPARVHVRNFLFALIAFAVVFSTSLFLGQWFGHIA